MPLALVVAFGAGLVTLGLTVGEPLPTIALTAIGLVVGIYALRRLTPPGTLVARPIMPAAVLLRGILTFAFFSVDAFVALTLVNWRGLSATEAGHRPERGDDHLDGRCLDPGTRRLTVADAPVRHSRLRGHGSGPCRLPPCPRPGHHLAHRRTDVRVGRVRDGPCLFTTGPYRPARCAGDRPGCGDERTVADGFARDGARHRRHRRSRRCQRPVNGRACRPGWRSHSAWPSLVGLGGLVLTRRLRPRRLPSKRRPDGTRRRADGPMEPASGPRWPARRGPRHRRCHDPDASPARRRCRRAACLR